MGVNLIDSVINGYSSREVKICLKKPNIRGVTYCDRLTIGDSINKIIETALKDLKNESKYLFKPLRKSDTFLFPDIHGRLDLFVQNMYMAGLIDKQGNWKGNKKTAVLLGDLISRGTYSVETLIYARSLQEQSKLVGGNFEVLIGNHEHCVLNDACLDFYNMSNVKLVGELLKENIEKGHTKIAYADNSKNMICVHAGIEKEILKWAIREIKPSLALKLFPDRKIASSEIFDLMEKNNITIEHIADWMNSVFGKDLSADAPLLRNYSVGADVSGVINSRKKDRQKDVQNILNDKTYKMNQFVGHTTTDNPMNLANAKSFGAVKKINHRFYLDYDLLRGKMAFVGIDGRDVYQMHSKANGLDQNFKPYEQIKKGIPEHLIDTAGCYHGNTKKLDFSNWSLKLIARLPKTHKKLEKSLAM